MIPNTCGNGLCINTPGSFTCDCPSGYFYDELQHSCIDRDECREKNPPCQGNAQCINIEGSFECACPLGYRLSQNRRMCEGTQRGGLK